MKLPHISTSLYVIATLALLCPLLYIAFRLNRGLDMTDAGYYYLNIENWDDIRWGSTPFSVVWGLLPLGENIVTHRLALFGLLCLSSAFAFYEAVQFSCPKQVFRVRDIVLLGLVGMAAISTWYMIWLPDPSYNSIAIVLILFLVGLTLRAILRHESEGGLPKFEAILSGALILALGYTRPQSAVLMGLILMGLAGAYIRPSLRDLVNIAGYGLAGCAGFLIVTTLCVEPSWVTLDKYFAAFGERDILQPKANVSQMERFNADILAALKEKYIWLLAAIIALIAWWIIPQNPVKSQAVFRQKRLGVILILIFIVVLFFPIWSLINTNPDLGKISNKELGALIALYLLAGVLSLCALALIKRKKGFIDNRRAVIFGLFCACLFAQIFLSANRMLPLAGRFSFYGLMAFVVLIAVHKQRLSFMRLMLGCIPIIGFQFLAFHKMEGRPYRLPASLAEQSVPTQIRGGSSVLLTDEASHQFLTQLTRSAQAEEEARAQTVLRPILIDATGRAPMLTYHLNMRPTAYPWLFTRLPRSEDLFADAINAMDNEDLAQAWLLLSPDDPNMHSLNAIMARGIDVQTDYKIVAQLYSPYHKTELTLLAPQTHIHK